MAVEIAVGNRGDNQWSSINYNSIRGENLLNNGFLNEFKLAMGNPRSTTRRAAASGRSPTSGRARAPARCRVAYLNGSADFNNPAAYANAANTGRTPRLPSGGADEPPSGITGDLDGNLTPERARAIGRHGTSSCSTPMQLVNVTDSGALATTM